MNDGTRLRAMLVGVFSATFDRYTIAPLLIPIAHAFGVSLATATVVASVYYISSGVAQLLWGMVSDRLGRLATLRLAYASQAIAGWVSALAPTFGVLVVARGGMGALNSGAIMATLVYIGDRVAEGARGRAIANVMAANALATSVANLAAGALADTLDWRLAFVLPACIAAVLAWLVKPDHTERERDRGAPLSLARVLRDRWATTVALLAVAEGAVLAGTVTFLAPALQSSGESATTAGLVLTAFGLATVVTTVGVKRLRLAPAWLLAIGAHLLVAGWIIAAIDQSIATILASSVLVGATYPFVHTTMQAWSLDTVPAARGTAMALFGTGLMVGAGASTLALGHLASDGAYTLLFGLAALGAAAFGLLAVVLRARF